MTEDWLSRAETICMECGGRCCIDAHPPVSAACRQRLIAAGVPEDAFESAGYCRLKARRDGSCILSENGMCTIHGIKPETCRAGPFTFDMEGDRIAIYLKHESICPMVGLLQSVPSAYRTQYEQAEKNIRHLVAGLTASELAAVCRIEEPETGKVGVVSREDTGRV